VLDDEARCRLKLGLASAQSLSADMPGALRSCQEVIDQAVGLDLPQLVGESALVVEPTFDPHIDRLIRGMCEQALAVLGADQAGLRTRVLAAYAVVCDHLSDIEEAERAVDEALSLVSERSDVDAMEAVLLGHHMVRSGPDGLAEREVNAGRMADLGTRTDRPELLLAAAEWRFDAAAERGDLARAGRELEAISRWSSRVGGPISRWRLLRCRAVLAEARGQLAEAKRYGDEALATLAPTGFPPAFLLHSGFLATLGHHVGYSDDTLDALGMSVDPADQDWPLEGIVMTLGPATVLADLGRIPEAARLYRRLGPASEWRETPHGALFTWAMGLVTATAVGADDDVVTLRARLGGFRGHHIVNGRYAMAYMGPAELWLGIGATHLGLLDDAIADLESATKACAANGAEGFRAESEYELARALVRRSGPGDLTRARSLAIGARRRCAQLGMPPILDKASALVARLPAEPTSRLTPREREVAALVAEGRTNREIATLLFISERTAQNHVQHILDKLHLPNRTQIAVWVQRTRMSTFAE
jgi:DNA-binding CsgD family transcriptional regulator